MKIEDFRNTTLFVDPFADVDLKNNSLLAYDELYHVVKSCED